MKPFYLILVLSFLAVPLVQGCSSGGTPGASLQQNQSPVSIANQSVSANTGDLSLSSLIKEAQKEGLVTIYGSSGPTVTEAMRNFTKKYGIEVDVVSASGAQISERIKRERKAGIYLLDAYVGGASDALALKRDGVWDPLPPVLIPEMVEPSKWLGGEPRYLDVERKYVLAFLSFLAVPLSINSNMVKQDEIKSYYDLLNPKWKDNIVMLDPTKPGFPGQWFQVFGFEVMNLDYMRSLANQRPLIVTDKRTPADWLAKGKYPLAIGISPEMVKEFIEAGAPVAYLPHMKEGTYTSSGGGNIAIMNNRPHPNASKLFANWLLTREAQVFFIKAYGTPSARIDVPATDINPLHVPDPNTKYFWADDEDFRLKQSTRLEIAKDIFGSLLGR